MDNLTKEGVQMEDRMLATRVARWFIKRADETGNSDSLTNMKLQKLLYYAHGFSLARLDAGIGQEPLQAWQHGPVAPEQYKMFSSFGSRPIPSAIAETGTGHDVPAHLEGVLEDVWSEFGRCSAAELRRSTHHEAPWRNAYIVDSKNQCISDDLMRDYFKTVPAAVGNDRETSPLAMKLAELRRRRMAMKSRTNGGDLSQMVEDHRDFDPARKAANARDFD